MKIAMVFDRLQIGGIERVRADYAKLFQRLGHEVTVINLVPGSEDMRKEFPRGCAYLAVKYPRWMAPERYAKLVKMNATGRFLYSLAYAGFSLLNLCYRPFCRGKAVLRPTYDLAIAFSGHYAERIHQQHVEFVDISKNQIPVDNDGGILYGANNSCKSKS